MNDLRVPPHSIEAERAVIGCILSDNANYDRIVSSISPADFYNQRHGWVLEAVGELIRAGQVADLITVAESFKHHAIEPRRCVDLAFLSDLMRSVYSAGSADHYAAIVKEKSMLRQLIAASTDAIDSAFDQSKEPKDIIESSVNRLFELHQHQRSNSQLTPLRDALKSALDRIDQLSKSESGLIGHSTGIDALDQQIGGLEGGKLYVVAGRPAMGKTTLGLNILSRVAEKGQPSLAFSLEMNDQQLAEKMIADYGNADYGRIRAPKSLVSDDWDQISVGVKRLKDAKINIWQGAEGSISEFRSTIRQFIHENGSLGCVMIDYLQLMNEPSRSSFNRNDEVGFMSRQLKIMAMEFNVPVIIVSQLNRSLESRTNKRPINSDLRESGAIEQDADVIMFVYRDEIYNPDDAGNKGVAEIIVAKNRGGEIGTVKTRWNGRFQRFEGVDNVVYAGFGESSHSYY